MYLVLMMVGLVYDFKYTLVFHSLGIEPWITGLPKTLSLVAFLMLVVVLVSGAFLKNYLDVSIVIGIDVNVNKVEFAGKLGV